MFETSLFKVIGKGTTALALSSMLLLTACDEQITVKEAAVDPKDSCSTYYNTISAARTTEINRQANNAVAGAVLGAVLGAAVSGRHDRAKGALIGATAGGLAGYSATYYQQKQQNAQDARTLLASVNNDARTEGALVTTTGKAVAALRSCRSQQADQLAKGIRAGKIDKKSGKAQLEALKRHIATDNKVISASFNGIGQRVDGYVDASAATAQVNRAEYLAAKDRNARAARTATPSVASVSSSLNQQKTADGQQRAKLEANVQAIEKLLG
ncbi:YMGG-like glycine zipper-containing protein [Paracoccus aminophilus]|uniref:YMGG-like Gly-zipper domain-containing protein n=1 Tax=Paracoccus aminophilus JCM 7686 TaxID=1367847 RepID=S5Y988_PARAH|nr:YMGG-like glycine zipper-containing protein [Paracoccus aminophilus]AGT07928.1 hypothetical protein JCM7686_0819 [Paracoccus aminophilus JCM 7686]